jgi:thiol:disulfide interchange protein
MSDQKPSLSRTSVGLSSGGPWVSRHRGAIVWTSLLAVIVFVQWPMLKGTFYRVSGSPAPNDGIPWRTDFTAALAEAKQSGKPVLLDFSASWCPPCQVMKQDVWPQPEVHQTVTANYIPVLIDIDAAGNQAVAARYEISAIPAILIVNADGKVLHRGSYMSKSRLLDFLARKPA